MYRLTGFDYSSPYYYMVTLKKREGRTLFLSLWPAETKKLDKPTMYARCHELGDFVVAGLG